MDNAAKRFDQICPECGGHDFVDDQAAGDLICKGCSLVVEAHCIDERSEWRTFADSDKAGSDPNRVGGPTNPLLQGGGLATVIGKTQGDGGASFALGRLNARTNQQDRVLMNAFGEIGTMCRKLGLVEAIKDRACELYKEYKDLKSIRGRKAIAFYAACIYIACRLEGHPRTFKEINAVATEASKRDIARCFRAVLNEMQDNKGIRIEVGTIHASDYMRRFGSTLGLTHDDMRACVQIANSASPKDGRPNGEVKDWDGRSPISVAAAIIYLISLTPRARQSGNIIDMRSIVQVTGVGDGTITATCRELQAESASLIPEWYLLGTKNSSKKKNAGSFNSAGGSNRSPKKV